MTLVMCGTTGQTLLFADQVYWTDRVCQFLSVKTRKASRQGRRSNSGAERVVLAVANAARRSSLMSRVRELLRAA